MTYVLVWRTCRDLGVVLGVRIERAGGPASEVESLYADAIAALPDTVDGYRPGHEPSDTGPWTLDELLSLSRFS
jgi:hypothetical protein